MSVYTDWEEESIRKGFEEKENMFFYPHQFTELFCRGNYKSSSGYCRKSGKGCQRTGTGFHDHFPWRFHTERSLSAGNTASGRWPDKNEGVVIDGEIICPFFPEGGRYTMDNIHYVKKNRKIWLPAGMTEFAKDKTFGYKSSDLTEYVEEKTEGKYKKEDCITISLEELNALDVQGIKESLYLRRRWRRLL